jgi:dipeptidyl-peptidase-3
VQRSEIEVDRFADVRILRYDVPSWDKLTVKQRKVEKKKKKKKKKSQLFVQLAYFLSEAGYSGRDIIYLQKHRFNLQIRFALEAVITDKGEKSSKDYLELLEYTKRVFMSNGIHHHYGNNKFVPGFSREFFVARLAAAGAPPLGEDVLRVMFDENVDTRLVDQREGVDVVANSCVNFYEPGITAAEAKEFYKFVQEQPEPHEFGINSRLERGADGKLVENVIRSGGLYGSYIDRVVHWLRKAETVAENEKQRHAISLLADFFNTGKVHLWTEFNIAWTAATEGDIDFILGFVEIYTDPLQMRGSFECIVQLTDFEASERLSVLSKNAVWFEQNAPILESHKRTDVVGIAYKVVNVCAEAGDASPSTPIGVNLPNLSWVREKFGSKSVSLGNIEGMFLLFLFTFP